MTQFQLSYLHNCANEVRGLISDQLLLALEHNNESNGVLFVIKNNSSFSNRERLMREMPSRVALLVRACVSACVRACVRPVKLSPPTSSLTLITSFV